MKKIILISIIFCLAQTGLKSETKQETLNAIKESESTEENPNFCIKGIIEFFKIVDILKTDQMPTDEQWHSFIESPGYKELSEEEFGKKYFKEILTVVFKPSESKKVQDVIEKYKKMGDYYSWAVPSLIDGFKEAELNRKDILNYATYLSSPEVLKKTEKYVSNFLPNAKIDSSFKINFIVFDDSRGYNPAIIGITNTGKYSKEEMGCLKSKNFDNYLPAVLLIAHEAFHNIRDKMLMFSEPKGLESPIIWALNKIENEGIADLIDKKPLYESDGCFFSSDDAKRIVREQKAQYAIINSINYLLTEISKNEGLTQDLANAINNIVPRSGHPTGYYMAKIIYSKFGNEYIKTIATNPFQFFVAYNEAAKTIKSTPQFSKEAIDYIKKLEEKYAIKK